VPAIAGMGIYSQPNSYECGPFALKHALLVLGVFADERRLARLAGTSLGGTDEEQLAHAAERFRCDLPMVRRTDAESARRTLAAELDRGNPTLICVDQWEHWLTVVSEDGGRYVLFDSAKDAVVRVVGWDELERMWVYRDPAANGSAGRIYDLHPVIPRFQPSARAAISVRQAEALLADASRDLARDWSSFARELIDLADGSRGDEDLFAVRLDRLLVEERGGLVRNVGGSDPLRRLAASRALERLAFVADAYDLRVLLDRRPRVVRDVADLLARHAELKMCVGGNGNGHGSGNGNGHGDGNGNGDGARSIEPEHADNGRLARFVSDVVPPAAPAEPPVAGPGAPR
jgi:hypothetical protein